MLMALPLSGHGPSVLAENRIAMAHRFSTDPGTESLLEAETKGRRHDG